MREPVLVWVAVFITEKVGKKYGLVPTGRDDKGLFTLPHEEIAMSELPRRGENIASNDVSWILSKSTAVPVVVEESGEVVSVLWRRDERFARDLLEPFVLIHLVEEEEK